MKTQKQLPNEFTFICDKHSREQLEKLGVEFEGFDISDIGFYYFVENSKVQWNDSDQIADCPLINLADYIEQEQPEPKWQEKTRDGYVDIKEVKQIGNRLAVFGIRNDVVLPNDNSRYWFCDLGGVNIGGNPDFNLIPYNPLLTTLEKELEEVRSKEKEILEKIQELKK